MKTKFGKKLANKYKVRYDVNKLNELCNDKEFDVFSRRYKRFFLKNGTLTLYMTTNEKLFVIDYFNNGNNKKYKKTSQFNHILTKASIRFTNENKNNFLKYGNRKRTNILL